MAKALVRPVKPRPLMRRTPIWLLTEGDCLVLRQGHYSTRSRPFESVHGFLDEVTPHLPMGAQIDGLLKVVVGRRLKGGKRHYTILSTINNTRIAEEDWREYWGVWQRREQST